MRSAPIGLAWHGNNDQIIRLASQTSESTRSDPRATARSVVTAMLTGWALDGMAPRDKSQDAIGVCMAYWDHNDRATMLQTYNRIPEDDLI